MASTTTLAIQGLNKQYEVKGQALPKTGVDAIKFDMDLGGRLLGLGVDIPLNLDIPGLNLAAGKVDGRRRERQFATRRQDATPGIDAFAADTRQHKDRPLGGTLQLLHLGLQFIRRDRIRLVQADDFRLVRNLAKQGIDP